MMSSPLHSDPLLTAQQTADWRLRVFSIYQRVRELLPADPAAAHQHWVTARNALFAGHPASPLSDAAQEDFQGLTVAPYDPKYRVRAQFSEAGSGELLEILTGTDGIANMERLGTLHLPELGELALWRHCGYGGGLFLPLRDGGSGLPGGSYGGGRYLLDSIKGAALEEMTPGSAERESWVLDFNFCYQPSCAYDPAWACPLPGAANRLAETIPAGELYDPGLLTT